MNVTAKTVTYALLALLVLFLAVNTFRPAQRLATGLAFDRYMTTTGLSSENWHAKPEIERNAMIRDLEEDAVPYAAFMSLSSLCMGLILMVAVAYTFRQKYFTRISSAVMGLAFAGLAGFFNGVATVARTHTDDGWYGAVGIAVFYFLGFYLVVGILALIRKAVTRISGTTTTLSEQTANTPATLMNIDIEGPSEAIVPSRTDIRAENLAEMPASLMNLDFDTPGARAVRIGRKAYNGWRDQSEFIRRWVFISLVWAAFIGLIVLLFRPFSFNGGDAAYAARTIFIMSLPPLVAGVIILKRCRSRGHRQ